MLIKEYTLIAGYELFPNEIIIPLTIDKEENCKTCDIPIFQIQYLSKDRFNQTAINICSICPKCDELLAFWEEFKNAVLQLDKTRCAICKKKEKMIDNLCKKCHPYAPPEEYWDNL